jgi:hypothetical protein
MKKPHRLTIRLFTDWPFNFRPFYRVKRSPRTAFGIAFIGIFLPLIAQSSTHEMMESVSARPSSKLPSKPTYIHEFYDQTTGLSFQRHVENSTSYRVKDLIPPSPGILAYFTLTFNRQQSKITLSDFEMNKEWGKMTQAKIREEVRASLGRRYPTYILEEAFLLDGD